MSDSAFSYSVVLLAYPGKSVRRLREILLTSSQLSPSACPIMDGDTKKVREEGADLTVGLIFCLVFYFLYCNGVISRKD